LTSGDRRVSLSLIVDLLPAPGHRSRGAPARRRSWSGARPAIPLFASYSS